MRRPSAARRGHGVPFESAAAAANVRRRFDAVRSAAAIGVGRRPRRRRRRRADFPLVRVGARAVARGRRRPIAGTAAPATARAAAFAAVAGSRPTRAPFVRGPAPLARAVRPLVDERVEPGVHRHHQHEPDHGDAAQETHALSGRIFKRISNARHGRSGAAKGADRCEKKTKKKNRRQSLEKSRVFS